MVDELPSHCAYAHTWLKASHLSHRGHDRCVHTKKTRQLFCRTRDGGWFTFSLCLRAHGTQGLSFEPWGHDRCVHTKRGWYIHNPILSKFINIYIGTAPIITTVSARSCYIASKWTFLTAPKQSHFRSGLGRGSPAARFATRGACPVRVKYCLVDKRSQPRAETVAIMALMGARLFMYFGKQAHARNYELSVYDSIKSPWTTPGTLVYHGASHIPSASASCTFELFLVDLTMAMDICSPASPSKFLDQLRKEFVSKFFRLAEVYITCFCCWKKQPGDA